MGKSEGGRGNKGGLSVYAESIGKSKQLLDQWTHAAEVYKTVKTSGQFSDKVSHLYEISKAPSETWQPLTEYLVKQY